jgi:ubiquinone/menaquinone biosynthesis C-methylase UbiE
MSTYVLMKIFEVFPRRYDKGIRLLTFGKLDKVYDRLVSPIKKGDRVLDIGCGTGAISLRAAR